MTYDFFAAETDKIDLLNFIFEETDLQIFELSSPYGQNINEYKSVNEITTKFDLQTGGKFALTFQMWSPRFKSEPVFRKVDLNPRYCQGHTFRYTTEGWGLIQLYFGGIENNILSLSHIGHFNQKGALDRETTNLSNGKVSNWDWPEIEKTSRKLKYQIHSKFSVKKIGPNGVLKGAEILESQGVILG